jgi:hydroxymethylpyrimidine/phosphomethylpyrimidine kinase
MTAMRGRVLIVAGSDSGGGAGIQADIKAVTALGGYAMTAITALTSQDTTGVHAIHEVPPDFIRSQMRVVLSDLGADCIKTGMLHRQGVLDVVADVLEEMASDIPVVVDPVMVAKGGARLLDPDTMATLKTRLIALAAVLTPNLPEAEALTGLEIRDLDGMRRAAEMLLTMGPKSVLLKGGHLSSERVHDVLATPDGLMVMEHPRIESRSTHGTGCTLASAVATGIAQGLPLRPAVARARAYVLEAIRTAPGYGQGHGPLNHGHTVAPFEQPD